MYAILMVSSHLNFLGCLRQQEYDEEVDYDEQEEDDEESCWSNEHLRHAINASPPRKGVLHRCSTGFDVSSCHASNCCIL
jgi:hypothetical protein